MPTYRERWRVVQDAEQLNSFRVSVDPSPRRPAIGAVPNVVIGSGQVPEESRVVAVRLPLPLPISIHSAFISPDGRTWNVNEIAEGPEGRRRARLLYVSLSYLRSAVDEGLPGFEPQDGYTLAYGRISKDGRLLRAVPEPLTVMQLTTSLGARSGDGVFLYRWLVPFDPLSDITAAAGQVPDGLYVRETSGEGRVYQLADAGASGDLPDGGMGTLGDGRRFLRFQFAFRFNGALVANTLPDFRDFAPRQDDFFRIMDARDVAAL